MRNILMSLAVAALFFLAAPLDAHEDHSSNLDVILDRVAPQPPQLEVRIVDTLAPQMLVSNRTGQTLEVLDSRGIPVIKIAPDRTWVNASAPAYYSEHPMSDRSNAAAASKNPRWVVASHEASWGWFDPRIQAGAADKPAKWHIDMRLAAQPVVVSGEFRARPVSHGYWMPAMRTPVEIAPRVDVAIIPGVVPAVTVANGGHDPVTVVGARGEPFLRIGADGVFANAISPTWMQSGRAPETMSPIALNNDPSAVRWTKVSSGSRYTWLEWRARCADNRPEQTPMKWIIPMLIGAKSIPVLGETRWIAIAPRPVDKPTLATSAAATQF
jgi:hypothetical protein